MFLYIDPGTGSMLFSILIGVVSTLVFLGRKLFLKLKFVLSGGKAEKITNTKIPYLVFSDHKRYWTVFKPICDEFEKRGIDLVYWTASPDDPVLSEQYKHIKAQFIGEGNKAFAHLNMMNAGLVLSTTPGLDVYQWKRSKNVDWYVHILHMVSDPLTYRMFGLDFYDAILLSGPYQIEQIRYLENKRNKNQKDLQVVGCTYMDSLLEKLKNHPRKTSKSKTVLVAPSWGKSGILAKYGEKILDELVATGYKIIVRPHPQSFASEKEMIDNLMKKYPESDLFKWNRDNDNFDVLNESDLLITDFSGIIFDYAFVFGKPLIYADTEFDSGVYDAAWYDKTLWTFEKLPDIGTRLDEKEFPNIKQIIDGLSENKALEESREKIRKECWANIGNSAKLTVDYIIQKGLELKQSAIVKSKGA